MNLITSNQLTMSSREIAELTGKEHKHVKRDINTMIFQLNFPDRKVVSCPEFNRPNLDGHEVSKSKYDHNGNTYDEYNLSKRYTELLITGYSVALRLKVIDRLHDLEAKAQPPAPQLPQNYLEALEQLVEKEKLLIAQAPKVAFVDNLVDRTNLMTATQVASKHKMSAVRLNKFLDELGGVYSKSVKRGRVFVQLFIEKGLGEVKQGELGYSQALFTPAGEVWIHEQLISERAV